MSVSDDRLERYILKHISGTVRCISCQRGYAPDELEVLARGEGLWFVRVTCDHCRTEGLIMVAVEFQPDHESQPPARPNASRAPADDTPQKGPGPISTQEVHQIARFLETYQGNLSEFLGES